MPVESKMNPSKSSKGNTAVQPITQPGVDNMVAWGALLLGATALGITIFQGLGSKESTAAVSTMGTDLKTIQNEHAALKIEIGKLVQELKSLHGLREKNASLEKKVKQLTVSLINLQKSVKKAGTPVKVLKEPRKQKKQDSDSEDEDSDSDVGSQL